MHSGIQSHQVSLSARGRSHGNHQYEKNMLKRIGAETSNWQKKKRDKLPHISYHHSLYSQQFQLYLQSIQAGTYQ